MLHSTLRQAALLGDTTTGLKLISDKMNRWRDLQTWFCLTISILSHSFFQENDKLGKFVCVRSKESILIKFQGIMYHYLFREDRGLYPRKASCGCRQRNQGGYEGE